MIPNDPKRAGEKFQRCRNRSSKLFTRTHIHMPVRVAIRRRGWHRGGGGKGTIKNKIKKTVLSKSRCNRLTTRGIYVESFLGAIMLFVSVARQRNISRIFNDERPRCTDCIESRKPAPRYAQLFVADYERERPNPPLSTNNSSPVLKIVSNRYLKKKKKKLLSPVFEIRKIGNGSTEKRSESLAVHPFFSNLSSLQRERRR